MSPLSQLSLTLVVVSIDGRLQFIYALAGVVSIDDRLQFINIRRSRCSVH